MKYLKISKKIICTFAVVLLLTFVPDLIKKVDSGGDTNAKGKKNKEGVATEPAANAADEETNDDISPQG